MAAYELESSHSTRLTPSDVSNGVGGLYFNEETVNKSTEPTGENRYIGAPHFELDSPIGEEHRLALLHEALRYPDDYTDQWRSSTNLQFITDNEASHRALDRVYSGPLKSEEPTEEGFELADMFLSNLHTAMAARNRFRIVQSVYQQEIAQHFSLNGHSGGMETLSIAAGSSRAVMEKMAGTELQNRKRMKLKLIDVSDNAIADGRRLAQQLGLSDQVDFRQTNFLRFNRYLEEGYNPKFTEIVGLFDYVPNEMVIKMLGTLRERMSENSSVLYSSVTPNDEEHFLHDIIGWRPMIYRTAEEMGELALQAGFEEEKIDIIEEPLKMCNLVLARK